MDLTHRNLGKIDIIKLSGRLVMADAPDVRQKLLGIIDEDHNHVILDLSGVDFMDSIGLSVLISVFKAARVRGGDVLLLNLTPAVRSLIELTRLQQIFEIFDDETSAIARLS